MEKYVIAEGKKIYCRIVHREYLDDHCPVLVFLHEGLGTSEQWKDFPPKISKHFSLPVLLYDRFGYGKSEKITTERQPDYMEKEASVFLPQILEALQIEDKKLILFGHSDGGSIAAFYASYYPAKVLAAIIEAPHFFIEKISVEGITQAVKSYNEGGLKQKLQRYHGENTESMFRTWTENLLSTPMRSWNTESLLRGITCPVLAIQGTEDDFGTLKQIEAMKNNNSGDVELLVIENCGHIPHHQARETVINAVREFVENILQ
jgi:pimeloyl-ACP methyl ester carboxylesterase